MKPILFPSTATDFSTQGLGVLTDAISCTVTEERNGAFELTMQYPDTGVHFGEITDRCIIYAIPSPYRVPQPFRIYRITRPMDGIIMVYAQHITYDLSGVPLKPFSAVNAPDAMSKLTLNAAVDSPFTFWTDKSTAAAFSVTVPSSTRSVLGGTQGSILDVYGGEYEWDGFTVKLYGQRGYDNGVVISYGKNLTDIEQDRNIADVATGIYPYWTNSEGAMVVCDPPIVNASGTYDFTRVVPVDFSSDFEEQPTPAQLLERAEKYVTDNRIGIPKTSITASFVQLEQFAEYENLALLEKCDLCDTVTIRYPQIGVEAKAEIVKIETDVLLERYNSVEIGDARTDIADTIVTQQQEINRKPDKTFLQQAVDNATNWITNGRGYMVGVKDADGNWIELCSLDTKDISTASNVWRWNNSGFGHSKNGYNGPYRTAITQDGAIVADFITTGTLNAALVEVINLIADHVTSQSGRFTMNVWAAIFSLLEDENLRARIYTTDTSKGGLVQVFSGTVTDTGGMGEDAYYSYLGPEGLGLGQQKDGNFAGTLNCRAVSCDVVDIGGKRTLGKSEDGQRIGEFDKIGTSTTAPIAIEWRYSDELGRLVLCQKK